MGRMGVDVVVSLVLLGRLVGRRVVGAVKSGFELTASTVALVGVLREAGRRHAFDGRLLLRPRVVRTLERSLRFVCLE
jgi:hypothetical protein